MLVRHHWPGNIRELQNVIERPVILSTGPVLKLSMEELQLRIGTSRVSNHTSGNSRAALDEAERQEIAALEKANSKVAGPNGAAALVCMSRSTLQFRIQKFGLSVSRSSTYRGPANIRSLEYVIDRSVPISEDPILRSPRLSEISHEAASPGNSKPHCDLGRVFTLAEAEREHISVTD